MASYTKYVGRHLNKGEKLLESLEDVLLKNKMDLGDTTLNEVKAFGQEVRMTNIRNRKVSLSS